VTARAASTQVREHIRAVMAGASAFSSLLALSGAVAALISLALADAELTLLAVDKEGVVSFFEGSHSAARSYGRPGAADSNEPIICGQTTLAEVWPDERLQVGMKLVQGGRDVRC
jgi:hypothetical protein